MSPSNLLLPPDEDQGVYDNEFEKMLARNQMGEDPEQDGLYNPEGDEGAQSDEDRPKKLSSDELNAQENGSGEAESEAPGEAAKPEAEALDQFKYKGGRRPMNVKNLRKNKWVWGGGIGGSLLLGALIVLFMLIGQLKVVSFANVLSAAGYARFNGIFQERATQNIFDATVSQGDGSTQLRGRSVIDHLKGRNLDEQLTQLGREDKFKLGYKKGTLDTVKIGDETISMDAITKELGFGDSFEGLSGVKNATARARVRFEFTERIQTSVGDVFATEPKYLRSRIFNTISDNIGFKFSRWKQAARDYFGKSPVEANVQQLLETEGQVGQGETVPSGVEALDKPAKSFKSQEKLQKYLEKTGGEFKPQDFLNAAEADLAKAESIQAAASKVSVATLAASVACMAHVAFNKLPEIYDQNVKTAQRQSMELLAARDQIESGDVMGEAVNAAAHQLDGSEESQYYQLFSGLDVSGDATIPRLKPVFSQALIKTIDLVNNPAHLLGSNPASDLVSSLNDKFCNALLSPVGMVTAVGVEIVATAVIGFLTDGSGAAAEQGGFRFVLTGLVKNLGSSFSETFTGLISGKSIAALSAFTAYSFGLQFVVQMLAGAAVSGASSGAEYFNTAAIGTSYAQNTRMQTLYGKPITNTQATNLDKHYVLLDKESESHKGIANRYFALSNPYSLATLAIPRLPSSFASLGADITSKFGNLSSIFNLQTYFGFMFHSKASAATSFDPYNGQTQLGFSSDELEKMRLDPSYSADENLQNISEETIAQYDQKYSQCFDPTTKPSVLEKLQSDNGVCSATELSQDSVFRYRLAKLDGMIDGQFSRDLDVSDAGESGLGGINNDIVVGDTSNDTCPAGTTDRGVGDGYANNQLHKIRLCAVPTNGSNIVVNAQIAGNLLKMVTDASAQGIQLSGGGFRTMQEQINLRNKHGCSNPSAPSKSCSPPTARPGYSNHQMGFAVDFNCSGSLIQSHSSPCFQWLSDNGAKYNFFNFPAEAWHFSKDGK